MAIALAPARATQDPEDDSYTELSDDGLSVDSQGEELPSPVHGSPSPAPEETLLETAINDLSIANRTKFLMDRCRQAKDAAAIASGRLLARIEGKAPTTKAYETYKHCYGEYAMAENHVKACRYHPGS